MRAIVLTALVLGLVAPLAAQEETGSARGRVVGPDDRPIVGAVVRVWPSGQSDARGSALANEDGGWHFPRLALGRWNIEVTAEGYLPAEGWFQVTASRGPAQVDIALRSLEETPPSFAENASTIVRWIERGNALLGQNKPAEARAEYERALPHIARAERPEVLQALARTHYLEGDTDTAIRKLQEAIAIAPEDDALRQLFTRLLSSAGRSDETEALLAEAAEVGVEPAAAPAAAPFVPPPLPELVEASPGRTGGFRTQLSNRSPLSGITTYLERYGLGEQDIREGDPTLGAYELSEESFQFYVPESYDGDEPYGLFVWVSPTPFGGFRNPEIGRVLAENNLIWVGANNSGNGRWGWYRVAFALDAVHNASELYSIDPERVYVAGYSGGGRISSQASMLYPDVFRGGFFVYGCDYFEQLRVPDRPGAFWPARFARPPKESLEQLKSTSRFVLLTGDRDFNRAQTKVIHQRMEADGFANLTYLQIPEADHYFGMPPEWFQKALTALDGASE